MSAPPPAERIAAYQAAYLAANGRTINVSYDNGWFTIGEWPTRSKVRGSALDEYTRRLVREVQ